MSLGPACDLSCARFVQHTGQNLSLSSRAKHARADQRASRVTNRIAFGGDRASDTQLVPPRRSRHRYGITRRNTLRLTSNQLTSKLQQFAHLLVGEEPGVVYPKELRAEGLAIVVST